MRDEPLKEIFTLVQKEINARNTYGDTALMLATRDGGNKDMVEALLDKGADVNARNTYGYTALMLAACYGNKDVEAVLINAEKITPERVLNFIRQMPSPPVAAL